MKTIKKKARVVEVYELIDDDSSITKRVEVYTDYADGFGFNTQVIVPSVNPKAISEMFNTLSSLQQEGFEIKFCFIEERCYCETALKKCLC